MLAHIRTIRYILIFALGFVFSSFASYAWWDCNWKYRVPITITETSGNDLVDYPVQLTVDTASLISAGKMKSDCGDIRFTYVDPSTGNEVEIPYWIESGCNSASTSIWIKVPKIPASSSVTVYMYYGNPSATLASNKAKVCPDGVVAGYCAEFGDAFDSGTLDSNKWSASGSNDVGLYCDVESGDVLAIWGGGVTVSTKTLDLSDGTPRIIRYWIYQGSDSAPYTCEDPDSNEDVYIQCVDSSGSWVTIKTHLGDGSDPSTGTGQAYVFDVPSSCLHENAQFRIYYPSASGNSWDYWTIDNFVIAKKPGLVSTTFGSEESSIIKDITILTPSNATQASSDKVLVNVSLTRDNYECSVTCNLQTVYPSSNSISMTTSSDNKYCWVLLDLNGLVKSDGELDYQVVASTVSSSKTSDTYTIYVDTSVPITLKSPSNNTIIHGKMDTEAESSSILDVTQCTIEVDDGSSVYNVTGTMINDYQCSASVDLTDSCPDDIWYRVWMKNSAGVWNHTDWYYADNDFIYDLYIESPSDGSYVDSDIVTIKAKFSLACKQSVNVYIDFTYPKTQTDEMSCSGTSCSYTKDLNYFVEPDGKVEYQVRVVHPNEAESISATFYVQTAHSVTIVTPKVGDPVLGSGFHVVAKSDSILKIDSCTPNLPSGAVAENIKIDPEKRTCEFDVNLENYCSSNTIDISVTMNNTAGVSETSDTQSHLIYDPPISVKFVDPTPSDGESLSLRYLPIKVQVNKVLLNGKYVPSTKKFMYEINGVNYTVYGNDDGYAIKELFHPEITSILGTKDSGSISFKVYGIGRCSNINATESRTVNIPAMIYKVDFVTPPTPVDDDTLTIKFMEVEGQVTDNILANTKCTLEISKDDGYTWIKAKEMDNCYAYLVNDELDTPLGYLLYRINITDTRWGESNLSIVRKVNIDPNAEPIPTVNSGMDLETIQNTIDTAIASNKPAVLFESGYYKVNLVIDPQGKLIRLIGANSVLTPASKGFPVIRVLSGDVILERFTIKDSLFNIRIDSGNVQMKGIKVYGGLYGVEAKNAKITIEDSVLSSKLTGIKVENIYDSVIKNTISTGKVWGMYFKNVNNVSIESSTASAKVFGILLDGVSNNNTIFNTSASAKVFGILINSGRGNTIRDSKINAVVFGIKMPGGNSISNTVIDGVKVFGIYTNGPNNISNVLIKQAKVFGAYMTGNASNITIYNSKLGLNLFGSGEISYLRLGDTLVNISYNGNLMVMEGDPTKHPTGVIYTGQAINKFGNGKLNITFLYDNPAYSQYYIYNILGGMATLMSSDKSVEANGIGLYALYMSS